MWLGRYPGLGAEEGDGASLAELAKYAPLALPAAGMGLEYAARYREEEGKDVPPWIAAGRGLLSPVAVGKEVAKQASYGGLVIAALVALYFITRK